MAQYIKITYSAAYVIVSIENNLVDDVFQNTVTIFKGIIKIFKFQWKIWAY